MARLITDPFERSLAFPVYPTSESSFLIPATRSHYRTLRAYIYRTDARSVSIEFLKAARLPGRTSPVPCIALNMPSVGHELLKVSSALIADDIKRANWQYKGKPFNVLKTGKATRTLVTRRKIWSQEPYESFALPGREFPFLVVEVADSQRHKDLIKKLHRWAQGSKAQCKVMIAFELEKLPRGDYRILMSVTKNKKVPIPEPPNGFRVVSDTVHDRVDISSQNYTGSFTISATEVCPEEWELDAVTKASDITISFNQFRGSALAAIEEKMAEVARNAQGDPTPDPDQEDVSTPSSSESGSLADELLALESESEEDDAQDPDYED
ncbi:MAG: hypothetical protein L6R42_006059 [Xanthoria sp. 1 TBL-2021]|nr:MAG: hypothetical protein L6R42_006059 [Xanthoria sp. 1 TBL-2021]